MERGQVTSEVDELPPVVLVADVGDDFVHHPVAILVREAIGPADADVVVDVFGEGHREHAVLEVGLDHEMAGLIPVELAKALPVRPALADGVRADVDGGVRPRALGDVFDDLATRDFLDQEHVAGPDVLLEVLEVVRMRRW
jgi:hypothetical protein